MSMGQFPVFLSNSPNSKAPPTYFFSLICAKTLMKLHINPAKQTDLSEESYFLLC